MKKHVPESQIRTLIESISGWLIRLVAERIANGGDARVTWDEFDKEFVTHFTRARRLELIDFALTRPPSNAEIDVHMRLPVRPFYLQQMESVNSTDDELIDAVYDFLRAKTNRDHWIEDEIIDETIASDFEDKLRKFWANTKKKFSITHKKETKEDQGQLVLLECMERTETVGTQHPPSRTVAGTYHALANNLTLGWHADWEKKFKK